MTVEIQNLCSITLKKSTNESTGRECGHLKYTELSMPGKQKLQRDDGMRTGLNSMCITWQINKPVLIIISCHS